MINKKYQQPVLSEQKIIVPAQNQAWDELRLAIRSEDLSMVKKILEDPAYAIFLQKLQNPDLLSYVTNSDTPFGKELVIYLLTKDQPLSLDPFDNWRDCLSFNSIQIIASYSSYFAEQLGVRMVKHNMFLQLNQCFEFFPVEIQEKLCQMPKTQDRMKKYPEALSSLLEASSRFKFKKNLLQELHHAHQSKSHRSSKM